MTNSPTPPTASLKVGDSVELKGTNLVGKIIDVHATGFYRYTIALEQQSHIISTESALELIPLTAGNGKEKQ